MKKIGQLFRFMGKLIWIGVMMSIPTAALSQNQFVQWHTDLTAQDVKLARNASASLYEGKQPEVADEASWNNEASGAGGTVRIVEANADRSCIFIRHAYKEGLNLPEKILNVKRCRRSDGIWLVSD
ncbi:MAG: hypothetical protein ACR2OY_11230 [Boseongicola sp.]